VGGVECNDVSYCDIEDWVCGGGGRMIPISIGISGRSVGRASVLGSKLLAALIGFVLSLGVVWVLFFWYASGPTTFSVPARRRTVVRHVRRELGISQRRACKVPGQARSTQRYTPKLPSQQLPLRLMLQSILFSFSRSWKSPAAYWTPRSLSWIKLGTELSDRA